MNTFESLVLLPALSGTALAAEPSGIHASMPKEATVSTRLEIAAALRTPTCGDTSVASLPKGSYVSQNNIIAYPSAEEASTSATWAYELQVMTTLLNLSVTDNLDSTQYKRVDGKNPNRFIEPGTTFVFTGEHQLHAQQATVNGRSVWLADELPAACFGSTVPENETPSVEKVCFVPLTTDTAVSQ